MTTSFVIDQTSSVPPFQQIVNHLVGDITSGALGVGSKLPTVRGLAAELGVAVNTVAKAYRLLEAEGHVETRGRAGTVVAGHSSVDSDVVRTAEAFRAAAVDAGLGLDEAIGVIRRSW